MKKQHNLVKKKLFDSIEQMNECRHLFAVNPHKDFTRNGKLSFETLIKFLLNMGGGNIKSELTKYFDFDVNTATPSAFVQQRDKLMCDAMEHLFKTFTSSLSLSKTFNGYRLLAADSTGLFIPLDVNDEKSYCKNGRKGYNKLCLNTIYDLCNQIYTDAIIQPLRQWDEYDAFAKMIDRSNINHKSIIVADRGYESYNVFAHAKENGWNYVVRAKDIDSNGIVSKLDLPDDDEFDTVIHKILSKRYTKVERANPKLYKYVHTQKRFDYLDENRRFYHISFRVVRIKIKKDKYQTIITNLPRDAFPASEIKKLYGLRWGIETSYRKLKYTIGLVNFHSKKRNSIIQEIFARLTMYNFCEIITAHIIIATKSEKYVYKVDFTQAVLICKTLILPAYQKRPPDVQTLLGKSTVPIRKDRAFPREIKSKSFVSFVYRVA